MTVVLASGSPRRRDLLGRLDVDFEVQPSSVDERDQLPGEDPGAYAIALAEQKAEDVAGRFPGQVVLGADTVVAIDGQSMGKPVDADDALRMLRLLRGRWHLVVTGVAVRGAATLAGAVAARVHMRDTPDDELRAYIATGEPMDKAGAYAVQGEGGRLVDVLEGCYETVVGLPLCLTAELLERAGIAIPLGPPACERTQCDQE